MFLAHLLDFSNRQIGEAALGVGEYGGSVIGTEPDGRPITLARATMHAMLLLTPPSSLCCEDIGLLIRAAHTGTFWCEGVTRRSGDPYVIHVIDSYKTSRLMGMDVACLCAMLMHDTVEDSKGEIAADEIYRHFGPTIGFKVEAVTKKDGMTPEEYEEQIAEASEKDWTVGPNKLCDVLPNSCTIKGGRQDPEWQVGWIKKTSHLLGSTLATRCREQVSISAPGMLPNYDRLLRESSSNLAWEYGALGRDVDELCLPAMFLLSD